MSNNNSENYYQASIGKLAAEELSKPWEPSHEEGGHFAKPESESSVNSLPESRPAQTTENSNTEDKAGELTPNNQVSESSQSVIGPGETMKRMMKNILAEPKLTVKTKYLNGGDSSCLRDVDFKWLKGEANSRAIFWFWAYIRKASVRDLCLCEDTAVSIKGWDRNAEVLYSFFKLPGNPTSTAERSQVIITYMNKISYCLGPYQSKKTFEYIRSIWLVFNSPIRTPIWLKKNDNECIEWAWIYLSKKKSIKGNVLSWFKPADLNERYIGIMGAIDCWAIPENLDKVQYSKFFQEKRKLLKTMKDSFRQGERRSEKIKLTLTPKSQKKLKELVNIHSKKENKLIEKLIDDEYRQYKAAPEEYKALLLKKQG